MRPGILPLGTLLDRWLDARGKLVRKERSGLATRSGGRGESFRVGEPAARSLQQPSMIVLAAGAALKVNRGARKHAGRILSGEFALDIRVHDFLARGAARVAVSGAQQLVKLTTTITHWIASSSLTPCPAAARRLRSGRVPSNRTVQARC